jgi:O-antigen/teichoic acid export membrane protein
VIFRNTLAQSGATGLGYLFSFIVAPIMLARLGLTEFGLWAVTGAMIAYVGLADLGIRRSVSRFVAYHQARDNRQGIEETVTVGLLTAAGIGVLSFAAALAIAPLVHDAVGTLDLAGIRTLLLCAATMLTAEICSSVFLGVPVGFLRMVPAGVAQAAASTINFVFSVGALLIHPTLVAYALANAAAEVLSVGVAAGTMLLVWRRARLRIPSRASTREIIGFGLKNQVGRITDLVNFQTDKLVIAVLIDVRAAGAYEIAARVVAATRTFAVLTVWAMIPTVTARIGEQGRSVIKGFYRRYTRLSVGLAFPLFVLVSVAAPYLLLAWLGKLSGHPQPILIVLSMAYLLNMTTGVADAITIADGRPGVNARYAGFSAILNLVLTVGLAPLFGLWGVLAGTFCALVAGSLLFLRHFHRLYAIPARDYFDAVLPSAALAFALGVPFAVWSAVTGGADVTRVRAALVLLVMAGLYGLVYWLAASRLGQLPERLTAPWLRRPRPPEALGTSPT